MLKVLAFDTFGTVTDWYTGISQTLSRLFPQVDASSLAIDWRDTYGPALAEVECGQRPWTLVDQLHRDALDQLLQNKYGITAAAEQLDEAVHGWHVIPGWPDSVPGLQRLAEGYTITTLSNGNVALLAEMAKYNGFPWDFLGAADIWRHYKPAWQVYRGIAEIMAVDPAEVLMVATHANDLDAARSCGLQTAYIERPFEYGPLPKREVPHEDDAYHATDIIDLAEQLGC